MSNFLHHSMEPVDPLTLPGGPRSRRNTAAAAAASSHSRPASVHNTEPVTHQRGVPEPAILPGQAIGRHGYQVRDHFTAALGGMNLDGSPLPARQASPTASMRSTRPAAPIPVEPPMSRSHVIDGGPTPVTSFYYGDGSTHRYGHNSSRPSTTGYAPEAQAASSSRGAGATPTRYRRYTVDVEQSPEMVRMKHRQQEDFQHYLSQAEHDRAEQQRRRQEEKVRDRDLQHHFVLDPKTAGVAKTNGRIQYSISEPKNFREKTLDPRHLENNPRPKHFVEEVKAPTPESYQYLKDLKQQMEFNHTRSEQEHARQQATTDKPVAAVMDESRLKNAPHPRHPRTLTTNTPVDVQQLDPSYKQSHRPQKSDLNTVLHEQMQHESERRAEEREKVYGNAPLVPDMRGRSRLPVRVSYSDDDGKKIASEERVMDHVRTITREHVPLSDRLGHEKGEPIHYRPFTDEEKRKTELQKERKKLLEEMHQERTSLEARLKQEEHAMEDMERASYPLYKGHKHTGPIRFSAAFTNIHTVPEVLAARQKAGKSHGEDLREEIKDKHERISASREHEREVDEQFSVVDRWQWNKEYVNHSPRVRADMRLTSIHKNYEPVHAPGTDYVAGHAVKTRLSALEKEHLPKLHPDEVREYHRQLDRQTAENYERRKSLHSAEFDADHVHWQNSPAVKLDPELREHKDRYTHGDPRKEHERQTVAIALNQENVPGVLERPRSD